MARKASITSRLNKLINDLKVKRQSDALNSLIWKLEQIAMEKEEAKIQPMELFLDIVESYQEQVADPKLYESMLNNAEVIYDDIFFLGAETPDFEQKASVFRAIAKGDGISAQGFFDRALYFSFSDKELYVALANGIAKKKKNREIFSQIKDYALNVREYIVDDMSYLTHLLRMVERLDRATSGAAMVTILKEELVKVQRSNGLYDVDPVKLAQVEQNVREAAATIDAGRDLLDILERKCNSIEAVANSLEAKSEDVRRMTEAFLITKTANAKQELQDAIFAYEEEQKQAVLFEKDAFLEQMFNEAEIKVSKIKTQAKTITSTAAAEMQVLGRDADALIRRIENSTRDDEKIKKILEKTRKDDDVMKALERIANMRPEDLDNIAAFSKRAMAPGAVPPPIPAGQPMPGPGGQPLPPMGQPMPPVMGPDGRPVMDIRPIPSVNPFLDVNVPFQKRYALVMAEKQKRMEKGELYHEMFDDVLTAVMENVNPYLIGPSGCGKTYMVKQIGELLNIDCTDIGYINEEYDILGYVTAMGTYSESNFYRLYKYGGIAFCDELDNGNSKATVKLNSFLSNQLDSCYHFPGGEKVLRHPSFRVIAAGNTDGNGADVNYNTREKIEESVQQRMIPIYVDYDNRVEKSILSDYPEWFEFACAFRKATTRWQEVSGVPAQGIFTTRDAYRIKQYLDNGSFTPQKVMNYEFVQTKEPEYLGFLKEELEKLIKPKTKARDVYALFAAQVDAVRKKGKGM